LAYLPNKPRLTPIYNLQFTMESEIKNHYNSDDLTQTIKTALLKAGKDLSNLELKDLSPIDQIHTGGARTSIELFKKTRLSPDALVLDAGCGLGGSSRLLARPDLKTLLHSNKAPFLSCPLKTIPLMLFYASIF